MKFQPVLFAAVIALLFFPASSSAQSAQELNELLSIAVEQRKAKVLFTYERCLKIRGVDDGFCRKQISLIGAKEKASALELAETIRATAVDEAQLSKQMNHCHDYADYNSFVVCKGGILERLKDEIIGKTLLID